MDPPIDITTVTEFKIPAAFDAHVHLRDGELAELVVPTVHQGGVNTAYVMPNLVPPITTVEQALAYRDRLRAMDPSVNYLMTLYLHENMTPATMRHAKLAGIVGVKSYPAGVTTNSASGVVDYQPFYPIFAEMEREGLVLNLHGEVPSTPSSSTACGASGGAPATTILNAEERFLPTLAALHAAFPRLRIVLEHMTTAAAVDAVQRLGPTVAGTITAHHLSLVVDDWAGDPFAFCKPVAKTPEDRDALLRAVVHKPSKCFLGSDSAPHYVGAKAVAAARGSESNSRAAPGVFTQPFVVGLVLDALEAGVRRGVISKNEVTRERLAEFLCFRGRRFYGQDLSEWFKDMISLRRGAQDIPVAIAKPGSHDAKVVPFRRGEKTWSVKWS